MTECASCRAWVVFPQPSAATVEAHYRHHSAGLPADLRESRNGTSQERSYGLVASRIARAATRFGVPSVRRIVDVGAGDLELTARLADAFPAARVEAWDFFADRSTLTGQQLMSERITLHRVDLNSAEPRSGIESQFDIVACFAVLEHVLDPGRLLRFLRSITAPGGIIYVAAPEVGSPAHRILRRRWPYYCPDEHLTIPSLDSVASAVAMAGGGACELRRINVHYSLKYLLRFLKIPVPLPRVLDVLLPLPVGALELVWHVSEDVCR